jgi:two-component system sensor histidine kinase MprB
MSFRTRLLTVAAVAVALAVAAASAVTYVVVRGELRDQIDDSLRQRAATTFLRLVTDPETGAPLLDMPRGGPFAGPQGYVQLVPAEGDPILPAGQDGDTALPLDERTRAVAAGSRPAFFSDAEVSGVHVRIYTVPAHSRGPGRDHGDYAIQIARSFDEVDGALSRIRRWLVFVTVGGVALAAGLGLFVAGAALAPVRRLTRTAEDVTETGDLSRRIEVTGRDELSRLAATFNTMLGSLEESARAQRQLVADASHELRTPLTSLRTNIDVLARDVELPPGERESLLRDVTGQLREMTELVAELVALARGDREPEEPQDVRLDVVAADAIERTRRNRPGVAIQAELEGTLVRGVPASLERAVGNLLDNAAKWSPAGGEVEVSVRDGQVVVRDHGPGIDADDLPYVFDRFYRAPSSRGMPGSGLGLAIVRQVAEQHGGSVAVEQPEGGGTLMRFTVPVAGPAAGGNGST